LGERNQSWSYQVTVESNWKAGSGAAAVGSKTGVWSTFPSQAGGQRAGESTGALVESLMCSRIRVTKAVSVTEAMMRVSAPQCLQSRGKTSWAGLY